MELDIDAILAATLEIINEVCSAQAKIKNQSTSKRHFFETVQRDKVINKVKFMDKCLVPKTKFLSSAREKAWSNYHREYLKHMQSVMELAGSPANAAWLCLKIFEHLVMLNYPVSPQSSNEEQCKSITEDDQDIVNYIGGSVVQKIKQKTFQHIQTVSRTKNWNVCST
ncbi:hypothetical protein LSAT2_014614 [Lamellibrachia satsuma]|nr:hypothetical protein LSAT2_014614 [Lamellibrachia satsuma]